MERDMPHQISQMAEKTEEAYDVKQQVGHLLRKAYQFHLSIFNDITGELQLTSVQFVTLCILRDHGDCSQAELVRATAVDQATIRGVVDRLAGRGLLELKKDVADGRKVVIALTSDGAALLDTMYPRARQITEETVASLNPAERVALSFLLTKMTRRGPSEA